MWPTRHTHPTDIEESGLWGAVFASNADRAKRKRSGSGSRWRSAPSPRFTAGFGFAAGPEQPINLARNSISALSREPPTRK